MRIFKLISNVFQLLKLFKHWIRNSFSVLIRRCFSKYVREAGKNLRDEVHIAKIARNAKKVFKKLEGRRGLKLHLGCGTEIRPGWLNIDLRLGSSLFKEVGAGGDIIFINYDLRRGLLLEEGSCEIIYSSHFFEHLSYEDGARLMYDCYRALCQGGVFRIVMPNFRELFERYLGDKKYCDLGDIYSYHPEIEPGTESYIDFINHGVFEFGQHKGIYDDEKIGLMLQKIGYSSVYMSSFQKGMDVDTPIRKRYSFYMEAVK